MSATVYLNGRVTVHAGDCLASVRAMADNSVDSVVTDPPYALVSIVKRFGKTGLGDATDTSDRSRKGADGYTRLAKGFMGKEWDNGSTAFAVEFWSEVMRVLKPGGHVAAFSGTRSYHRLACAIEDAGFDIRDQLAWTYGSGFPKSHNVSMGIDKAAKVKGSLGGPRTPAHAGRTRKVAGVAFHERAWMSDPVAVDKNNREYLPGSDAALEWVGWGTALKPAWEPICLARKPLSEGTVAANVLRWGTGAINVDGCRVDADWANDPSKRGFGYGFNNDGYSANCTVANAPSVKQGWTPTKARFPANIIHDGSEEVLAGFPESKDGVAVGGLGNATSIYGSATERKQSGDQGYGGQGSAARFFYSAKADGDDRLGSKHPTVKPVDLMQWLCRLITPPGGIVMDMFAGTGTTGEAAFREGFRAVLCEREAEYLIDISRRMSLAESGITSRKHASAKARATKEDHGPLFGGTPDAGGANGLRSLRSGRTIGPIGMKE